MPYKLLDRFESLFVNTVYNHRKPHQGDRVALELYEDLADLGRSGLLAQRIEQRSHVVNTINRITGKRSRRGDGTFGELVPSEQPILVDHYAVARGPIATLEIGVECKIISVAQARQVDRVINDLRGQVKAFRNDDSRCLTVALVGVNRADQYSSVEGANKPPSEHRITRTTGLGSTLHPAQEADRTIGTLRQRAADAFDEFLIFEFLATNEEPFPFTWSDRRTVEREYSAALTRIARSYATLFPS